MAKTRSRSRKSTATRGSKLLHATAALSSSELQQLVALGQKQGIKLVHWSIYGQPAPDAVSGAFQIKPGRAGDVLTTLARLKGLSLDVFPLGLPVPREMIVRFNSRAVPRKGGVIIHG